jgi:hypothetical protein
MGRIQGRSLLFHFILWRRFDWSNYRIFYEKVIMGLVEIRSRRNENPKHPVEVYDEIFIDGLPVEMGEGTAELTEVNCKIHGRQKGIYGYNQGGHDGMSICVECCKAIIAYIKNEADGNFFK